MWVKREEWEEMREIKRKAAILFDINEREMADLKKRVEKLEKEARAEHEADEAQRKADAEFQNLLSFCGKKQEGEI